MSSLKTMDGDLIKLAQQGAFDVIVHGCNCFGIMGGGIARGIKSAFPEAYAADQATPRGERAKLGTCSEAIQGNLVIVNAYTQYDYRGGGVKVDYAAVRKCMTWIKQRFSGKRIGLPKIGAGLAGGDWPTLQAIIEAELPDEDVTIVIYQP